MEKLELKYLAPYLPYGLKAYHVFEKELLERDVTVNNVMSFVYGDTNAKIALRPLSELTKEIEINGKKFTPYIELLRECSFNVENMSKEDVEYFKPEPKELSCIETRMYLEVAKLFEWHFDVFGLIEKGLAIDINTIEK